MSALRFMLLVVLACSCGQLEPDEARVDPLDAGPVDAGSLAHPDEYLSCMSICCTYVGCYEPCRSSCSLPAFKAHRATENTCTVCCHPPPNR